MNSKKLNIGGQALIGGVMIRGPCKYTAAVRKGRKIIIKHGNVPAVKHRFLKWPFIRGFVNLVQMLVIGMKSLMWSAEQAAPKEEKIGKNDFIFGIIVSVGFAILFFMALPYLLANLLGFYEEKKPVLFNIVDGLIRILIFLAYIFAISFMKDVKVLFQYHGAEHKAIHCYEHGRELNAKNVKKFTTLHPRCGTSFLIIVFIVSVFVFSLLPYAILAYYPNFLDLGFWARKGILLPARIILVPLIAGISYEVLKISDKKQGSLLFRIISMPGLWLQKITTKEPTNRQIEVAILSLSRLLKAEKMKK